MSTVPFRPPFVIRAFIQYPRPRRSWRIRRLRGLRGGGEGGVERDGAARGFEFGVHRRDTRDILDGVVYQGRAAGAMHAVDPENICADGHSNAPLLR